MWPRTERIFFAPQLPSGTALTNFHLFTLSILPSLSVLFNQVYKLIYIKPDLSGWMVIKKLHGAVVKCNGSSMNCFSVRNTLLMLLTFYAAQKAFFHVKFVMKHPDLIERCQG